MKNKRGRPGKLANEETNILGKLNKKFLLVFHQENIPESSLLTDNGISPVMQYLLYQLSHSI